ncbi:MAG TPA: VOC family protein [Acidimicrobiales bacterium]|nr:VOC family protein [Acidimicrobiales bacterium]
MDNVLIVVEDLEAAKAFFAELGMELEGEAPVEGRWVDRVVGLNDVRADITMTRTLGRPRPGRADEVPYAAGGES